MPTVVTPSAFSLEGKIALITGGGRGLGLEIGRAFGRHGAQVLVNGAVGTGLSRRWPPLPLRMAGPRRGYAILPTKEPCLPPSNTFETPTVGSIFW